MRNDDLLTTVLGWGLIIALFLGFIFLFSAIGALIISILWPLVIPAIFPGAVAAGTIAGNISFWTAFGLMVLTSLLFKPSSSSSKKE